MSEVVYLIHPPVNNDNCCHTCGKLTVMISVFVCGIYIFLPSLIVLIIFLTTDFNKTVSPDAKIPFIIICSAGMAIPVLMCCSSIICFCIGSAM